uniref:Uncharacterized protein n=1 Tax=Felis catus TaxID=9685 RepID=A0ABI7ZGC2_FELCA
MPEDVNREGKRGASCPARGWPCSTHTCVHIVGPPAGLAAASCWGAACAGIEDIIDGALHLAVIDGLGALGGAGEEDQAGQGKIDQLLPGSPSGPRRSAPPPRTPSRPVIPSSAKPPLNCFCAPTFYFPSAPRARASREALARDENAKGCYGIQTSGILCSFTLKCH